MKAFRLMAVGVGALGLVSGARGNLLEYEGFNYAVAANSLNGKTGGGSTGFSAAWASGTTTDIVAGSLTYSDPNGRQLVTTGNTAFLDSTSTTDPAAASPVSVAPTRLVTTSLFSSITGPLYISFTGKQTFGDQRDLTMALFVGTAVDPNAPAGTINSSQERLSIGHGNPSTAGATDGNTNWGAYTNAVGQVGAYSTTPATTQSLVVVRVDLNVNGDLDRFKVYVNPTLGSEPAVADAESSAYNFLTSFAEINKIRIRAGGSNATLNLVASQAQFDEIRIGTDYGSVTPSVAASIAGDANYNGRIDADDYVAIDRGFANKWGGFMNGDFNASGTVDAADYLLIDTSFKTQGGSFSPDFLAGREAMFGEAYVEALTGVPEPGAIGMCAAALALGWGRRRARSV